MRVNNLFHKALALEILISSLLQSESLKCILDINNTNCIKNIQKSNLV